MSNDQLDARILMQLNSYKLACVFIAGVRLGIFEALRESKSVSTLTEEIETEAPELQRLLFGLELMKWVERTDEGYRLTTIGSRVADADSMIREQALLAADSLAAWGNLAHGIRLGVVPYETVHGRTVWERRASVGALGSAFNRTMTCNAWSVSRGLLSPDVLPSSGTIVDIGGGYGHVLAEVLLRCPKLKGILIETNAVAHEAREFLSGNVIANRISVTPGDMFDLPEEALNQDVYLLANVLHDWPDEAAQAIASQCVSGKKLIVVERLVHPGCEAVTALHDLHMMAVTGGKQRTVAQMRGLLEDAGFEVTKVAPGTPGGFGVVEAVAR